MSFTRREFLHLGAVAALAWPLRARLASARGLLVDRTLEEVITRALGAAKKAGATYADVRLVRRRSEGVATREDHIIGATWRESYGMGVRVIANGAWGFAASPRVESKDADRVAQLAVSLAKANAKVKKRDVVLAPVPANVDVWQTPLVKDPFKIPLGDKATFFLECNAAAMKVKGAAFVSSGCDVDGEWKLLASTDGAYIEQEITRVRPWLDVTAVDSSAGEFESRSLEMAPRQGGWEYIEDSTLLGDAAQVAEDAVKKLKASAVSPGTKDLILAPTNLWLTIHETVGHPTELDRALGYEANLAGTSFATVDLLGKLKYASPIVTLYADKTTPSGLATCGYDDDGVATQRWDLVKDGLFVGYQTTRDQAAWIGEKESRGSCYAQDFKSVPFQRMPNVSLAPGAKDLGVQDLIAATDDGIYITGNGSWSIDHQRHNFQFGGQMFYEVKNGKIGRTLRQLAYQSNSLDFWRGCDLVAGAREWWLGGAANDGKGEPMQVNAVSHGCPPARFRGVNILDARRRA